MGKENRRIFIDPARCSGCRLCELACSMAHHGILSTHRSRIKIITFNDPLQHLPVICQACDDAPCIKVCPANARTRQPNRTVTTDVEKCIGCRACLYICHLASPTINPDTGQTMTCDLCADETSDPWCVLACRSENALKYIDTETHTMHTARRQAARTVGRGWANPKHAHGGRHP